MNYINININNINEDKIIIPKKNLYCSNCNRRGHTFKLCNESIISNGIIGIFINNFKPELTSILEDYLIKNLRIFTNRHYSKYNNINKLILDEDINLDLNNINKHIQFLMVQRKNSLGYLEFIRGRYSIDSLYTVTHLLQQMTPNEILDINTESFDKLWDDLWDINNIKNKNHHKEYISSKQKFYQLKLLHNNIMLNTLPFYEFNEWGFPKGRRELYETDLVCAIREFEEETTLKENQYIILEKCKSIKENLIGTNNVKYTHNYFLALINENKSNIDETNKEIGETKVLNLIECLNYIRPYHKHKINIVKNIYIIINNFLNEYDIYSF